MDWGMSKDRPFFSVCIPAYNRVQYLRPLLDSVLQQDYRDFEIVVCEDSSHERAEIRSVIEEYQTKHPGVIQYCENVENKGYDGNIRELVARSQGVFCFFMGNDDIMCLGALEEVASAIKSHNNIGMVLKSYAWFDSVPEEINQEIRYFSEEKLLTSGIEAITVCYRRSGVISGYIINRDMAQAVSTDQFDGSLFYQMYLTATVLVEADAIALPKILVLCRNSEIPEFGNSKAEKGIYTPGKYTPEARINMLRGALDIIEYVSDRYKIDVTEAVISDYAHYFYPYIRDQLKLSLRDFFRLYRAYSAMGFGRYLSFHVYCMAAYVLGEERFDSVTRIIRGYMGRSPHFGGLSK